ncbi:hypothetical protein FI667_g12792, partial [Globisporangium splendens]
MLIQEYTAISGSSLAQRDFSGPFSSAIWYQYRRMADPIADPRSFPIRVGFREIQLSLLLLSRGASLRVISQTSANAHSAARGRRQLSWRLSIRPSVRPSRDTLLFGECGADQSGQQTLRHRSVFIFIHSPPACLPSRLHAAKRPFLHVNADGKRLILTLAPLVQRPQQQLPVHSLMARTAFKRRRPSDSIANDSNSSNSHIMAASPVVRTLSVPFAGASALDLLVIYRYAWTAVHTVLVRMLRPQLVNSVGASSSSYYSWQWSECETSTTSSSSLLRTPSAMKPPSVSSTRLASVHQTGPAYRSNNAGDGPEKTRDRKSWFPRFKSNWLGTYRSKQMFHCCECAVADAQHARYKGSEGKHCACGQDQWHLAKTIEEAEYNRRMEISKALGGLRYDEALERLKTMGTSELDLKRIRCESDETSVTSTSSSVASSVVDDHLSDSVHVNKRIKNEPGLVERAPSPATRAYANVNANASAAFGLDSATASATGLTQELLQKLSSHPSYPPSGSYTPLHGDYSTSNYDQLVVPVPFGADEDGFGELLQGFLEEGDPRNGHAAYPPSHYNRVSASMGAPRGQYGGYNATSVPHGSAPHQRSSAQSYPQAPSTFPVGDVDAFDFFNDGHSRGGLPSSSRYSSASAGYQQQQHAQYSRPHIGGASSYHHHPHSSSMAPPLATSTSFSIV